MIAPSRSFFSLYGVSGGLPASKAAHEGIDIGEPVFVQFQRRTGAGLFGRSSAIQDDLGVLGQFLVPLIHFQQG